MSDQETRLRELLERMAGEVDAPPSGMPRKTLRRASRGALTSLVASFATVAVLAAGVVVGIRAFGNGTTPVITPATTGPTTVTSPTGSTGPAGSATAQSPFTAIDFVDAQHGWMADADGILATSDGGATWTRQYSGQGGVTSFDFLDPTKGWAVDGLGLLRTTDGSTWEQIVDSQARSGIRGFDDVDFVSPSVGWAIWTLSHGFGGPMLVQSTDGGRTWTTVRDGVGSVCMLDQSSGYATTAGGELTAREVLKTTDGGSTWQTLFQAPGQWNQAEMACPNSETAWVLFLGGGAAGTLDYAAFRTADGGSTWTAELTSPLESNDPAFDGVPTIDTYPGPFAAVSANNAVFTGWCSACDAWTTVMRTTDGTTWQRSKIDGFLPQQVSFADAQHGWLVAQAGFQGNDVLLATADGGATWSQVYPETSAAG